MSKSITEPDPLPERAFPFVLETESWHCSDGMELRDYFAAKAIIGLVTSVITDEQLASAAYKVADAMMEARKKKD